MIFRLSDQRLAEQALSGSQRGWVRLVKRHESAVYNYCLRMTGDAAEAMDLMQEVFLAVYRHLPAWRGQGSLRAWIMRIASNRTMDYYRRQARLRETADEQAALQRPAPASGDPDRIHEQFADNREIQRLLDSLPLEQRLVVELKFFHHFTFAEIAAQTGASPNTVKSRLYAALEKMKGQLEECHVL